MLIAKLMKNLVSKGKVNAKMKKIHDKIVIVTVFILLLVVSCLVLFKPINAKVYEEINQTKIVNYNTATQTYGNTKYTRGVGNVTVWINYNSGVGYWQSYINNARQNWMYPGWSNPIYMNFVSSNYGSQLDLHLKYKSFWGSDSVLAETRFYSSTGARVQPQKSNWYYSEIYINHDAFSKPSFSNEQALGTVIHEMGHAFGLAHNNTNVNSIMCQTAYGRRVQRVQKTDNDAINRLY